MFYTDTKLALTLSPSVYLMSSHTDGFIAPVSSMEFFFKLQRYFYKKCFFLSCFLLYNIMLCTLKFNVIQCAVVHVFIISMDPLAG